MRTSFKRYSCLIAIGISLLGLAAAAVASETDWAVLFRSSDTNYGNASGTLYAGTATGSLDGQDPTDKKYTPGYSTQVVSYQPAWSDYPPYYSTDKKAPFSAGVIKSWTLLLWASPSYSSDTLRLSWWSTAELTPPSTIAGWPLTLGVWVINDPTGTFASGATWIFPAGATGSSTLPAGFIDFGNAQRLKMSDNSAQYSGVKLGFGVVVPEPSSLSTLLSSVIAGSCFVIRRRRRVK
ncbi:MAG TPA: hypothetical protein PKV43_01585 [Armatimonadota bacterium]|nr:hypothetical protein [Armatimonadota bacterium]